MAHFPEDYDHASDSNCSSNSDTESESSFHSANDSFLPYDEEIEPIADDEEAAEIRSSSRHRR